MQFLHQVSSAGSPPPPPDTHTAIVFTSQLSGWLCFIGACLQAGQFNVYASRLFTKVMVVLLSSPSRIPGNGLCYFILGQCRLMTGSKAETGQLAQTHSPVVRPQWERERESSRMSYEWAGVPSQHSTNHSTRNYDKHHSGNKIQQYIVFFFRKTSRLRLISSKQLILFTLF